MCKNGNWGRNLYDLKTDIRLLNTKNELTTFQDKLNYFKYIIYKAHHGLIDKNTLKKWFEINKMTSCLIVDNINSDGVHKYLGNNHFDICISFGASWIKEKTLSLLPTIKLNLHGGNIQNYRGLDSHLWSSYHLDGTGFLTTLHMLSLELDCGNIVHAGELDINQISELYMLRSINTKMANHLVLNALNSVEKT